MSSLLLLLLSVAFGGELRVSTAGPVRVQLDGKIVPVDGRGVVELPNLVDGLHEVVILDQLGRVLKRETYTLRYEERLRLGYIDDTLVVVGRERVSSRPPETPPHNDRPPHHEPPPTPPAPPAVPHMGSFELTGAPAEQYRIVLDGQALTSVGDGSWLVVNLEEGRRALEVSRGDVVVLAGTVDIVGDHHQRCALEATRRYAVNCDATGPAQTFIGGVVPSEPEVAVPATVSPLDDAEFRTYLASVGRSTASTSRVRVLQSTAPTMAFWPAQAEQVIQLMYSDTNRVSAAKILADRIVDLDVNGIASMARVMSSDSSRVELVRVVAPYCIDPQNAIHVGDAFYSDSSRTTAVEIIAAYGR